MTKNLQDDVIIDIRNYGGDALEMHISGRNLDPKREYRTFIPIRDKFYRFRIGRKKVISENVPFFKHLLSLPMSEQRKLIRSYYGRPDDELQTIVCSLFLNGAVSPARAIRLAPNRILETLVHQGQVMMKGNAYYLSEEGIIIAEGGLKIYPELAR